MDSVNCIIIAKTNQGYPPSSCPMGAEHLCSLTIEDGTRETSFHKAICHTMKHISIPNSALNCNNLVVYPVFKGHSDNVKPSISGSLSECLSYIKTILHTQGLSHVYLQLDTDKMQLLRSRSNIPLHVVYILILLLFIGGAFFYIFQYKDDSDALSNPGGRSSSASGTTKRTATSGGVDGGGGGGGGDGNSDGGSSVDPVGETSKPNPIHHTTSDVPNVKKPLTLNDFEEQLNTFLNSDEKNASGANRLFDNLLKLATAVSGKSVQEVVSPTSEPIANPITTVGDGKFIFGQTHILLQADWTNIETKGSNKITDYKPIFSNVNNSHIKDSSFDVVLYPHCHNEIDHKNKKTTKMCLGLRTTSNSNFCVDATVFVFKPPATNDAGIYIWRRMEHHFNGSDATKENCYYNDYIGELQPTKESDLSTVKWTLYAIVHDCSFSGISPDFGKVPFEVHSHKPHTHTLS
eukprot:GHVR01012022.1.p1 GENE.GHVR01012022.1~~GHVR01012022.1.p1  ORF type:complete len:463 (+),score=92.82 GHVR01012022.1:32-1420(+)